MISWQCHTLFSVRSNMYRQPGLGPPLNICMSNLSTGRSLLITSSSDTVSRRSVENDSGRSLLRINWTLSLLDLWLKGVAGLSFWSLSLLEDLGTEEGVLGRRNPSSISILDPLFPFLLWCFAGVYWCSRSSVSCNSLKIKKHIKSQCTVFPTCTSWAKSSTQRIYSTRIYRYIHVNIILWIDMEISVLASEGLPLLIFNKLTKIVQMIAHNFSPF